MLLKSASYLCAVPLSLALIACGGDDSTNKAQDPTEEGTGGTDAGGSGFSPGAADPCKNMPSTDFENDHLCLEAPPPEMGFQIHFGPSDYDDPDEIKKYSLEAGQEAVLCLYQKSPNTEDKFNIEQHIRMRTGTHHMIMWSVPEMNRDKAKPHEDGELSDGCRSGEYAFFLGAQGAISENGGQLDIPLAGQRASAPENEGIASKLPHETQTAIETHYINLNTDGKPILREIWINVIYADPSKVKVVTDPIFWIGGLTMNVQPHTREIIAAGPAKVPDAVGDKEVRLLGVSGHAHAHTERLSVWVNRKETPDKKEMIYETYDWAEPLNAQFDSAHDNPPLGAGKKDGAVTGVVALKKGDEVRWECEVNNTIDSALKFGDLAITGEMCNVFGYYIPGDGTQWPAYSP